MNALAPYFKAVVGFIAPAAVVLAGAVQDNSVGGALITPGEWVTAACSAVITAASVYAATNTPNTPAKPKDPADAPAHRAM